MQGEIRKRERILIMSRFVNKIFKLIYYNLLYSSLFTIIIYYNDKTLVFYSITLLLRKVD